MAKVQDPTDEMVAARYRLLEVVHREEGRIGWHGQDVEFGRPVALTRSRLPDHLREQAEHRTAARILGESERMGLLCPGKVPVIVDVVVNNGFLWTVTQRSAGVPLPRLLGSGPVNYVRAARIGLGLLDVISAVHRHGQTHGDLSPGQICVDEQGAVTVGGFGLMGATSSLRVTAPSYASPEQARGERTGPAADLWTLGAILYAMVEGRPVVRDRGRLDATLRAVDRLPIRHPQSAGPLGPAILGLMRRDPLERVPEPVVREALTRILRQDLDDSTPTAPLPVFRDGGADDSGRAARTRRGRPVSRLVLVGGALGVTVVCFAVLTAAGGLPGSDTSASGPAPAPTAAVPSRDASGGPSEAPTGTPSQQTPASPSPSSTPDASPSSDFSTFTAPQGFSIDLPKGWKPVQTDEADDLSYRVTFGESGDPRTLAVTFSTRLGPDPVKVWAELEPSLRSDSVGFERLGDIRAVDYQGHEGADMEWLSTSDGVRERTLGRGFLIGGSRGFSLRWTTPADEWDDPANQQALDAFFQTFKETSA